MPPKKITAKTAALYTLDESDYAFLYDEEIKTSDIFEKHLLTLLKRKLDSRQSAEEAKQQLEEICTKLKEVILGKKQDLEEEIEKHPENRNKITLLESKIRWIISSGEKLRESAIEDWINSHSRKNSSAPTISPREAFALPNHHFFLLGRAVNDPDYLLQNKDKFKHEDIKKIQALLISYIEKELLQLSTEYNHKYKFPGFKKISENTKTSTLDQTGKYKVIEMLNRHLLSLIHLIGEEKTKLQFNLDGTNKKVRVTTEQDLNAVMSLFSLKNSKPNEESSPPLHKKITSSAGTQCQDVKKPNLPEGGEEKKSLSAIFKEWYDCENNPLKATLKANNTDPNIDTDSFSSEDVLSSFHHLPTYILMEKKYEKTTESDFKSILSNEIFAKKQPQEKLQNFILRIRFQQTLNLHTSATGDLTNRRYSHN